MTKKDYMKPATRVVKIQHHSIICASPYDKIQSKNNSEDDDNPIYDGTSSSSIWDAN